MKSKRILSAVIAAVLVMGGTAVVTESPASAASKIKICNSSNSTAAAFSDSLGFIYKAGTNDTINPGECKTYNNSSSLRIKFVYYESYRFRRSNGKYGACHNSSESTKSNPGNYKKYIYRGYARSNCRD